MAFKKIDDDGVLPGPRAVFVSGYTQESHQVLLDFLNEKDIEALDLVPCREDDLDKTVGEVLQNQSEGSLISPEKLPPVMLWSGIGHQELDHIIRNFKDNGLPRPIFATTTPHNLDFSIKTLMRHLLEDQREIREAQKRRAQEMRSSGSGDSKE